MTTQHNEGRILNRIFITSGITFFVALAFSTQIFFQLNAHRIERYLYPVVEDWTFRDWRQEDNGNWSAVIYIFKMRDDCLYLNGQIPTVLGIDIAGEPMEAILKFIDDQSEGNNRPTGWQRLDKRVEITNKKFQPGTDLRGIILHDCGEEMPFISEFGPATVGVETNYPYVIRWIDADRVGRPDDYR